MEVANWLTLGLLLTLIFLSKFIFSKYENNKNYPPTPPSLPIIGHLHLLKEPVHRALHDLSAKYGDVLLLRFGICKVLLVSSPAAVEECFTKNDVIFANRPRWLAGKHLNYNYRTVGTTPYGARWRKIRRLLALEVFSTSRLAMFANIRQEEVQLLLKELFQHSIGKKEAVKANLSSKFVDLSFNVMMRMAAGKRYYGKDVIDKRASEFRDIIREFAEIHGIMNLNDLLPVLQLIDFQGVEKKMKGVMKKMDTFLQCLVDEQRKIRSTESACNNERTMTLIDVLLSLQEIEPEFYTDVNIKAVVLVLLVAGSESSATTMEWTMSLLLNHPETMKKVVTEIDTYVGFNRLLDETDLSKLTYLQNVINETFRLYPTFPLLLPHESSDDCSICGFDVPKGTVLLVNLWTIHRDPKLWVEPTKFLPERFESEESDGYKLIPFGIGRRACPGAVLARKVMVLALGALIQAFEWGRINNEEINMAQGNGLTMPKAEPLEAMCKPRQARVGLLSAL
ncbi:hypothetical protein JCGZ_16073 [Jatropha curcas]|uniref:Uncharacterized protein n=2 Tax=Jatropha curcas TaxID=180498 RepID=A0A067KZN9_JATCU|nr:hypothetical protein JCGZ_16073 [Jatropha curcas]